MTGKIYDIKKRSYLYAVTIIRFLDKLQRGIVVDVICRQLLRSATSVGANIAEAQACGSKKDFANFYRHSLKSANESKFWINLLADSGKSSHQEVEAILIETNELSNILASCLLTLKGKKKF